MDVAIVTMTRCPADLPEWIEYHLGIGISRIYLRLEGDRLMDMSIQLRKYPEIRVLETNVYPDGDQMVRQIFLVEAAVEMARQESMDYLLHIDDDELLHIHPGLGLQEMLMEMEKESEYDYLHLDNIEAVYPHTAIEINKSCFQKTTWFRECKKYSCRSYGNGKSMARLSATTTPEGVHYFKGKRKDIPSTMAWILHFESCDFEAWREKFRSLPPSSFSFYDQSHKAIQQHQQPGNEKNLYRIYTELTGFQSVQDEPLINIHHS